MSVPRTDAADSVSSNGREADASDPTSSAVFPNSDEPGSDWIRQAFADRVGLRATPDGGDSANGSAGEPEPKTENVQEGQSAGSPEPSGTSDQPPFKVFYSQEDFERQLQSEVDRRESVRRRKQQTEEEQKLLEEAPHEYADRKRRELAEQKELEKFLSSQEHVNRVSSFAQEQIGLYDEQVLRPLQGMVEDSPEKAKLLQEVGPGIEGRGALAKNLLALREKQIEARVRKAMADDPVLIKEILVKHGGQRAEPETVSAVGAAPRREDENQDDAMNRMMRGVRR